MVDVPDSAEFNGLVQRVMELEATVGGLVSKVAALEAGSDGAVVLPEEVKNAVAAIADYVGSA